MTVLVFCFLEVEYGEDRGGNDKECRVHKFMSWTDPLASTKRQRGPWVLSESPVFVEKSLGFEFFWIRVYLRIVQDRPEPFQVCIRIEMDVTADVPCVGYHYGSRWAACNFILSPEKNHVWTTVTREIETKHDTVECHISPNLYAKP